MIWWKKDDRREVYNIFFAITMVNDIINQLSWIGWMMWWDGCVYTRRAVNRMLFFDGDSRLSFWWCLKCSKQSFNWCRESDLQSVLAGKLCMNACPFIEDKLVDKDSLKGFESVKIEVTINISISAEPSSGWMKRKTLLRRRKKLKIISHSIFSPAEQMRNAGENKRNTEWRWKKFSKARLCDAIRIEEITFVSFFCQTFSTQFQQFINYVRWTQRVGEEQATLDRVMEIRKMKTFENYESINFSR